MPVLLNQREILTAYLFEQGRTMNEISAKIQHLPGEIAETWIVAYTEEMLEARDEATIEAYTHILEKLVEWLSLRPGNSGQFRPQAITRSRRHMFLKQFCTDKSEV